MMGYVGTFPQATTRVHEYARDIANMSLISFKNILYSKVNQAIYMILSYYFTPPKL